MDSSTRPPATADPLRDGDALAPPTSASVAAPAEAALSDAPPGALARLGQVLPGVEAVVRFAYRTALGSALAAGLVVLALATHTALTNVGLAVLGLLLALPALALALAGWTLADLARLPSQLREAALAATGRAAASGGPTAAAKGSRIGRLLRSLWAARGLALLTKGGWLKAVGALRFLRLASLPFALGLVAFVALNGLVIVAGLVALLVLLV